MNLNSREAAHRFLFIAGVVTLANACTASDGITSPGSEAPVAASLEALNGAANIKPIATPGASGSSAPSPILNSSSTRPPGSTFKPPSLQGASLALVSSRQSHAIEAFDSEGAWRKTFASTGARTPFGLAQSPITGHVFVTTYTDAILRYDSSGNPIDGAPLTIPADGNVTASALFSPTGELYVATYFGGSSTYAVNIYRYAAADVDLPSPVPSIIPTDLIRGDQLAFDSAGDICLAAFASETVKCYAPGGALAYDYHAALLSATGATATVEPAGVAFDNTGRLFVSSVFAGDVLSEASVHGPVSAIATKLISDVQYITFDAYQNLYVTTYHQAETRFPNPSCTDQCCPEAPACWYYDCQDSDFSSDVIYRIAPNGTPAPFIAGHIYGPHQMIFAKVTGCAVD
jgi:hypothetical protein